MVSADGKIKRFQKCASFMIRLSRTFSHIHILARSIERSVSLWSIIIHMNAKKITEENKKTNMRLWWKIFECNYSVESGTYQMYYSQIECSWKRKGIKRKERKNSGLQQQKGKIEYDGKRDATYNLTLVITWPQCTAFGFTRQLQLNRQASDRSTVWPYDTCFTPCPLNYFRSNHLLLLLMLLLLQRSFAPFFHDQLSIAQNYYNCFLLLFYAAFFSGLYLSCIAFKWPSIKHLIWLTWKKWNNQVAIT